ncbi:MAG: CotS family spore coat protein [Clostridia bacterium]|nr:CotS family spore coat protein [Clostridia bacterium]
MPSFNGEPLELVLSNYDLSVLGIKNESYKDKKGVWWIEIQNGLKILKKISNSEDTLKHILHAVSHLIKNGIKIPSVNKTKDSREYVKIDETCYIVIDAVLGRNPNYNSPKELSKIVKELAKFHKASEGFFPLPDSKPKIHIGKWIEDYSSDLEDMKNFYEKELSTTEPQAIGKWIIKEFPYFLERANHAIEGLKGEEYKAWVEKGTNTGCLCHQDFAAGNLIMDANGDVFIIDTDSLTIDIPARDIRKLLNKIMKKNGKWDMELAKKIFSCYQSENPLSVSEWKVVMLDLMYPHLFLGAMNKYYYRRDKEWTDEKYLKRIKEMTGMEKTIAPILEDFDSILNSI